MKNFWFLLLFLASIFITSCVNFGSSSKKEDAQKQEESQLWEEVLSVHDEVMPKMSAINKLQRELTEIVENNSDLDSASLENVSKAIQKLEQADDAMMEWMQGFRQLETLQAQQTHEQILLYLEKEKAAINTVKEMMNTAIEDGQTLLEYFGS